MTKCSEHLLPLSCSKMAALCEKSATNATTRPGLILAQVLSNSEPACSAGWDFAIGRVLKKPQFARGLVSLCGSLQVAELLGLGSAIPPELQPACKRQDPCTITKAGPPVRVPAQAAVAPGARAVRAMSSSRIGLVVAPGGAGAFRGSGGSGRGRGSQRLEGNTQSSSSLPGVSATRAACWASGRAQCPAGWQPGSESAFSVGGCRVSAGPGGGRSNACKSLAGGRHDPASKIFHGVALHICGISKGDEHSCRQGRPGNVHRLGCYSR